MKKLSLSNILLILMLVFLVAILYIDIFKFKKIIFKKHIIEVMYYYGGYGTELLETAAKQFEEINKDVKINIWVSPRISDKIRLKLLAGEPPDIIYPGGLDLDQLIRDGYFSDLQPLLSAPSYGKDKGKWEDSFYKGIFEKYRVSDKTYGLPVYFDTFVFWYNKNIFKKYNILPPKTWKEFDEACSKLKSNGTVPIALQGRAAMVFCGTWFPGEMKNVIPEGFEYSTFAIPSVKSDRDIKGDSTAMGVGAQYFFLCNNSKEPKLAGEFIKFMCSPGIMSSFVKNNEALTSMPEANKITPKSLKGVVNVLDNAKFYSHTAKGNPYPGWDGIFNSYLTELVTRPMGSNVYKITPEEFAKELEKKAENLRKFKKSN